jgi:hypothetical protein
MSELVSTLKRNGAELVIIDGAASRKSTASITFADGCILATGASYSHKMNTVIAETAYYAELLSIPRFPDREILLKNLQELINKSALENSQETTENQCFFFSTNGLFRLAGSCFATETVDTLDANKGTFDGIFFNGILTKIIVDRLLSKFRDFKGLNLVTLDGNGIQISSNQYFTLKQRNMNFYVINPINLLAVTSNPTSPAGICFKKEEFKNLLQKNIKAPVFDVYDSGLHLQ